MEAPTPDRYAWPVVDEEAVEVTCSRIARHLARATSKIVGLLPVARFPGDQGARGAPGLAPLLASLAGALARYLDQDIAIIEHWRSWRRSRGGEAGAGADGAQPAPSRLREVRPRVVEVTPRPSDDAIGAGVALQSTLRMTRKEFGAVLVDLGGYAAAGTAPATLELCDGIVLVVPARRTRISAVSALANYVPSAKRLGAILLGSPS